LDTGADSTKYFPFWVTAKRLLALVIPVRSSLQLPRAPPNSASDERQEMALQAQRKLFEQEHRQLEK
jgi:hypothetical protein